jgi:ATP-dependent RNA helicase HelY
MDTIWGELKDIESQYRTDYLPDIDPGFVWPALRWARGQSLPKSLRDTELQPGDFVRWTKQVIDILGQIAIADVAISRTARQAVDAINRGIVAW